MLKESVIVQAKDDRRPILMAHASDLKQPLEVSDEPIHDLRFKPLQVDYILQRVEMKQELLYWLARLVCLP